MLKFLSKYLLQSQVVSIIGVITGVLLARSLLPENRGILVLFTTIPQLISRLTTFGYEQSILIDQNHYTKNQYFFVSIYNLLFLCLPVLLILDSLNFSLEIVLIIFLSAVCINYLRIKIAFLNLYDNISKITIINISQAFLYIFLVYCLSSFSNHHFFFFAWVFALFFSTLLFSFKINLKEKVDSKLFYEISKKSSIQKPSWLIEILFLFGYEFIILGLLYSSETIGHYAIAKSLSLVYYQVFTAAFIFKAKNKEKIKPIELLAMLGVAILSVFIANFLIPPIFGNEYMAAQNWLPVCFFTAYCVGFFQLYSIDLGKIQQWFAPTMIFLVTLVAILLKAPPNILVLVIFTIPTLPIFFIRLYGKY